MKPCNRVVVAATPVFELTGDFNLRYWANWKCQRSCNREVALVTDGVGLRWQLAARRSPVTLLGHPAWGSKRTNSSRAAGVLMWCTYTAVPLDQHLWRLRKAQRVPRIAESGGGLSGCQVVGTSIAEHLIVVLRGRQFVWCHSWTLQRSSCRCLYVPAFLIRSYSVRLLAYRKGIK